LWCLGACVVLVLFVSASAEDPAAAVAVVVVGVLVVGVWGIYIGEGLQAHGQKCFEFADYADELERPLAQGASRGVRQEKATGTQGLRGELVWPRRDHPWCARGGGRHRHERSWRHSDREFLLSQTSVDHPRLGPRGPEDAEGAAQQRRFPVKYTPPPGLGGAAATLCFCSGSRAAFLLL
jgi:hypothetical protein